VRGRLEQVLALRLRETAKQKGVALSHLADRAGVARSYMWLLLNGRSSATLDAIQRLAEALDVEPLVLLALEVSVSPAAPKLAAEAPTRARKPARRDVRVSPPRGPKK
jgi:transcriptional regulator with XRE-family HTH domain